MGKIVNALFERIEALGATEQSVLFELLDEDDDVDLDKIRALLKEIQALPEKGKEALKELIQENLGDDDDYTGSREDEDEEDEESEEEEDEDE